MNVPGTRHLHPSGAKSGRPHGHPPDPEEGACGLCCQAWGVYMGIYVCWVSSVMSDSATLQIVAHQVPLSMGFSRQEYWSGLPYPSPGDLPNSG